MVIHEIIDSYALTQFCFLFQWRKFNFFDINHNADFKKVSETIGVCVFSSCTVKILVFNYFFGLLFFFKVRRIFILVP